MRQAGCQTRAKREQLPERPRTELEEFPAPNRHDARLTLTMRHVAEGTPIEPELARRVRERAELVTDEIRREHGDIDVVKLLHDAREDG